MLLLLLVSTFLQAQYQLVHSSLLAAAAAAAAVAFAWAKCYFYNNHEAILPPIPARRSPGMYGYTVVEGFPSKA